MLQRSQAGVTYLEGKGLIIVGGFVTQYQDQVNASNEAYFLPFPFKAPQLSTFKLPFPLGEIAATQVIQNNVKTSLFCGGLSNNFALSSSCFYTSDGLNYQTILSSTFSTSYQNCLGGLEGPSLASTRDFPNSIVYLTGGKAGISCNYPNTFYVFQSLDGGITFSFLSAPLNIIPRYNHGSLFINNKLIIIGGTSIPGGANSVQETDLNDIWSSSDGGNTFIQIQPIGTIFSARNSFSTFFFNNQYYVMSGYLRKNVTWTNDVWMSNDLMEWTEQCPSNVNNYIGSINGVVNADLNSIITFGLTSTSPTTLEAFSQSYVPCGINTFITTPASSMSSSSLSTTNFNPQQAQASVALNSNSSSTTGLIAGILGSLIFIGLLIGAVFYMKKKKTKSNEDSNISKDNKSEELLSIVTIPEEGKSLLDQAVRDNEYPSTISTSIASQNIFFAGTNDFIPFNYLAEETVGSVKQRLLFHYPKLGSFTNLHFLFSGKHLDNDEVISSYNIEVGTTIHLINICNNIPETSLSNRSIVKTDNNRDNVSSVFKAFAKRKDSNEEIRRSSRNRISSIEEKDDRDSLNDAISSGLYQDFFHEILPLDSSTSQPWLPLTGDDSLYLPGSAKHYQRSLNYTLVGQTAPEDDANEMIRGLVKPLNLLSNGSMEGINSIIFLASVNSRTCVLKGLLPLNDVQGYENHFANQEAEFKIPSSLPPHPNVISILHQFTASSVLVYPWISKEVRDLNQHIVAIGGKPFIRRQTTYVVMDFFPSTLRRYKKDKIASREIISERELLFMLLQVLKAVDHLCQNKVSHRDIKDDNIFISRDGSLILGDFGCALACGNNVFQYVSDIANRIGSSIGISPEVQLAISHGPSAENKALLWDIYKKNDIYALGVMFYNLIGIKLPSSSMVFTSEDIPNLPALYSEKCNLFMKSLVSFNHEQRLDSASAIKKVSLLLWGPPKIFECNDLAESWIFERRLDLFFNVNCEKNESTTIGIIPTNEWPCFKNQIEKKACIQFFYDLKPEEILLSE